MKTIADFTTKIKSFFLPSREVAPIEDGEYVIGDYAIGAQFIRTSNMYKAKVAITHGTQWTNLTYGTDYEVADTIITQVSNVSSQIQALANDVGDLTGLDTTVKTDLVSAINECVVEIEESGITKVTTPSFSSLPQTYTATGIDGDYELAVDGFALVSPSSAMGGDWNINTAANSITISGTFVGSTACTVKMSFTKPVKAITAS